MRVLVTGGKGMLGRALQEALAGHEARFPDVDECDVTDAGQVDAAMAGFRPELVVHGAAWTDVDGCERDPTRAWRVNTAGSLHVARAAAASGSRLIAISTDYVFGGDLGRPLTEDDPPDPRSRYGLSKLEGERAVLENHPDPLILRTCGVYGPGGRHFPGTIARKIREGESLRVVDDQIVSPTYSRDLARVVAALATRPGARGLYHVANDGAVSWHRFACEIAALLGRERHPIAPVASGEIDRPAERPAFSALGCGRLLREQGLALRSWNLAIAAFVADEGGEI